MIRKILFIVVIKFKDHTNMFIIKYFLKYNVKRFYEFINKLIEILQLIMISMISYVANAVFICWFAMNCLLLIREIKLLIITNTMNMIKIMQPSNFNVFLYGYFFHFINQ